MNLQIFVKKKNNMMSLSEALTFGAIVSELRNKENQEPHTECCFCKHMKTQVEAIAPGEGQIIHKCGITGKEVEYGGNCVSGNIERKE